MLGFRKKILFGDIVLFLIFIALLFPFVEKTVDNIIRQSLESRASELISKLRKEPSISAMRSYLKRENAYIFFRITLFDARGAILYDTTLPTQDSNLTVDYRQEAPELKEALKYGRGYSDRYSALFKQPIAYAALSFEVRGQEYVLRIGLPFAEIRELTHDFEIGFLMLGAIILLLYSIMSWAIIHRLSIPIQQIIDAIEPYQEGKLEYLPRIDLGDRLQQNDEFAKLAYTLNSMNQHIQKQFEHLVRQKDETEAILESLGEGVIAVDCNHIVTYANAVARNMLGVKKEQILMKPLANIEAKQDQLLQKCTELLKEVYERSETVIQTFTLQGMQEFYFDLIAAPLTKQSGTLLVLQDKTSDYRVVEMGKDFIANASHELRTPITIIRGFAETLNDHPELSAEMQKEITGKIVKTSYRLDSLLKSLLTLADIENFSEESFQLKKLSVLCEHCKNNLLTTHPEVRVRIEKKSIKDTLFADPDLIEMAIANLLQNAVKYSPSPAAIEIVVSREGANVIVSIKDFGIGIPEVDVPHIFDRFYTVDKARSRKFGGTGLGLSIVKTIVQKHGGKVEVFSKLGHGTTFKISLPGSDLS